MKRFGGRWNKTCRSRAHAPAKSFDIELDSSSNAFPKANCNKETPARQREELRSRRHREDEK